MAEAVGLMMLLSVAANAGIEPPDEIIQVAVEAGVEPVALHGAVNTTQLEPRTYLAMTGELKPPAPGPWTWTVWESLSRCEATGNWAANTGNGYYGGLQFDRQTWLAYGGGAYAPTANLASKAQQIAIAERLRAARGYQPWPACRRLLRLP